MEFFLLPFGFGWSSTPNTTTPWSLYLYSLSLFTRVSDRLFVLQDHFSSLSRSLSSLNLVFAELFATNSYSRAKSIKRGWWVLILAHCQVNFFKKKYYKAQVIFQVTPGPNSHSKAQFIRQGPIHIPRPNSYSGAQFILQGPIHTQMPNSYSRSPQGPIPQKTSHNFPKFRKEGSHVKTRSLFRSIFEEKKGSLINNRPLRSLFHHFVWIKSPLWLIKVSFFFCKNYSTKWSRAALASGKLILD